MFELTETQQQIYDSVRDFADTHITPHALDWDRDKHFPVDMFPKAGAMGLGGIYVREDAGGSGLSRMDAVLAFEALATGCPGTASYISIHNMVASMIDRYGTDEQRHRWLPGLCAMTQLSSYCLTEPDAGSDAAALRTTAVREGDEYILNGVKQFISGAGVSDVYVVMARTGGPGPKGISSFIVPAGTEGLSFGPNEDKMGWRVQPTRQVIFENARIPAENLLADEGMGFTIAMSGLDGGRINIAACSLGGAKSAIDATVAYLKSRKAFGSALIENTALQFRLADMATEWEVARTAVWRAAQALDAGDTRKTQLCAMAKRFATDAGFEIANQALQLHGGYGYLTEYGIEKIVRDLRVHQILEGTNEIMRVIVARQLIGAK